MVSFLFGFMHVRRAVPAVCCSTCRLPASFDFAYSHFTQSGPASAVRHVFGVSLNCDVGPQSVVNSRPRGRHIVAYGQMILDRDDGRRTCLIFVVRFRVLLDTCRCMCHRTF